jgi:hypothetical protein
MRFKVVTAAGMKMTVLWNAASCSLADFADVSDVHTAYIMREAFLKTAILKTWEVALPMSVSMN